MSVYAAFGERTSCAECGAPRISARGLCHACYGRHYRRGTLPESLFERIAQRPEQWLDSMVGTDGCWPWPWTIRNGYGIFHRGGRADSIHRLSYEHFTGPIPDGMHIDHQCHNADPNCTDWDHCPHRRCANPAHLEAVTVRENTVRGHTLPAANLAKTHCAHGHEYVGDNLRIRPDGARACRACERARHRRRRAVRSNV